MGPPVARRRSISLRLLLSLLAVAVLIPASAQEPKRGRSSGSASSAEPNQAAISAAVQALPPKYRLWIQRVAGLMTRAELDYFLSLRQDYRRDAFMEAFWQPRDPDPLTPVNELRRRWQQYLDSAGEIPYADPRFTTYLLNGPPGRFTLPDGRPVARCFS